MFRNCLILLALIVGATGCVSSSILVGTARPPIDPSQVRLYVDPPERFEKIAILESNSDASWAITAQQKTNKAVERLKIEAAKYGANGVLLQNVGDQYNGSVGVGNAWASGNSAFGIGSSVASYRKAGSGLAIYVFDQTSARTEPVSVATATQETAAPQGGTAYEAALRYASERGCGAGGVSLISDNTYRASCPSTGRSLLIDCQGSMCKESQ
ncbi:hypothetical protein K4L06_16945 [Lysobacter sp. BMK333-48F3]|uniref:hypothetical protein n=1 Tax=Lysobacter sp. BMK333-48F3 TaxID=2867962 RepID=UPI001C8CB8FA|nr:hypothetical protein [Lysobacter sp. BMK333-48F3]MBX9402998.1 hypothetical protein [Lysobacter sp. BMK333-48F3]